MTEEELQLLITMDVALWEAYLPYLAAIVQQEIVLGGLANMSVEEVLANIETAGLSGQQVETMFTTALNNFTASVNYQQMLSAPSQTKYIYVGAIDGRTRDLCLRLGSINKPLTMDEIIRNYGNDVLVYRGGYNCRHQWEEFEDEIGVSSMFYNPSRARNLLND